MSSPWKTVRLEEVVEILDRLRVPVNRKEREKRIAGKKKDELYPYYGANGQVGWIDDYIFDEKLVLLAEDGGFFDDPTRPIAYVVEGRLWVNNHAHVLRANQEVLPDFLMYALNSTDVISFVSGTTRLKLNQTQMRKIPIPLPPIHIQQAVVDRLSYTGSRTTSAKDALRSALRSLETLEQSLLVKAFRGELVVVDNTKGLGNDSHSPTMQKKRVESKDIQSTLEDF